MLNHARRRANRMLVMPLFASFFLLCNYDTAAQFARDLPIPEEPWLAEAHDRYAVFNRAVIACYQGSMRACDAIWLNDRVLFDSWLGQYGRTCGGRVDRRAISRANLTCTEAFPGNE